MKPAFFTKHFFLSVRQWCIKNFGSGSAANGAVRATGQLFLTYNHLSRGESQLTASSGQLFFATEVLTGGSDQLTGAKKQLSQRLRPADSGTIGGDIMN